MACERDLTSHYHHLLEPDMSLPSFDVLSARAKEIVAEARAAGSLRCVVCLIPVWASLTHTMRAYSNLTPKLVFSQLDGEYDLESDTISGSEYRKALRKVIKEAAVRVPSLNTRSKRC